MAIEEPVTLSANGSYRLRSTDLAELKANFRSFKHTESRPPYYIMGLRMLCHSLYVRFNLKPHVAPSKLTGRPSPFMNTPCSACVMMTS
jgi:hypothetical protein